MFFPQNHYNLEAMKIPDAKAAVDKEWKNARDNPSMATGTTQGQKRRLFWRHKTSKEQSILLRWWTSVISKKAELEPKFQK